MYFPVHAHIHVPWANGLKRQNDSESYNYNRFAIGKIEISSYYLYLTNVPSFPNDSIGTRRGQKSFQNPT